MIDPRGLFGDCAGSHVHEGQVVCCELGVGHPPPHATAVGRPAKLVTWEQERDRRAAQVESARWRREHEQ